MQQHLQLCLSRLQRPGIKEPSINVNHFGHSEPTQFSWKYLDPVWFNFISSLDNLQPEHRAKVMDFRNIKATSVIEVLTRASLKTVIATPSYLAI